jgi:hypothetical protein
MILSCYQCTVEFLNVQKGLFFLLNCTVHTGTVHTVNGVIM